MGNSPMGWRSRVLAVIAIGCAGCATAARRSPPPPPAPAGQVQEGEAGAHAHHHPAGSERLDREDRLEMARPAAHLPDTPEVEALKSRFTLDYMLSARTRDQVFERYLGTLGTRGILDVLEVRNPFCHDEAHELGRVVYRHFRDVGRALGECGSRCTSACLHGVLKEAFGNRPLAEVSPRLASVCTEGAMREIERPGNCAHGMGHALMLVAGDDVEGAIGACAGFPSRAMAYYCATGVFMELFARAPEWAARQPAVGLHFPCDTHQRYPAACYRYQTVRVVTALGGDREAAAEECRSLPSARRRGCFHGLGFAALKAVSERPERIATACPASPLEDQTMCIEGLVESFAAYDPAAAAAACEHLEGTGLATCRAAAAAGTYRLDKPSLPLYLNE